VLENKVQIRSNTYAESIINTIREPLIVLDQNLRVVAVSRSFYEFFKVKPEDTIGELIYNLGNKQWDIPRLRELLETILPQKTTFQDYEVEHDFATIGRRIMLLNARQIEQASGKELIILLAIEDITERKKSEEKINTMAYHDHLTGLPNRALFFDRLGQAMSLVSRTQKLMAVLMLDLDRFKPINDELGHAWGDKVLIEVSKRLQQCTRSTDTVARLGGDEFSIILVDVNSEEHACKIAEDIITAIREPLTLKESQYTLGVSIGICMVTSEDNNIKDIMRKADTAMYQGKKKGGSYVIMH